MDLICWMVYLFSGLTLSMHLSMSLEAGEMNLGSSNSPANIFL